jgi:hypothetical protein
MTHTLRWTLSTTACLLVLVLVPGCATTIGDSEEQLFPDPSGRTLVRLEQMQNLIARFEAANGRLPPRLDDLLTPATAGLGLDVWKNRIRYTVVGERYELRSAGPDAQLETPDDIFVRGEKGVPPFGA